MHFGFSANHAKYQDLPLEEAALFLKDMTDY